MHPSTNSSSSGDDNNSIFDEDADADDEEEGKGMIMMALIVSGTLLGTVLTKIQYGKTGQVCGCELKSSRFLENQKLSKKIKEKKK